MFKTISRYGLAGLLLASAAQPASAQTFEFNGTRENVNPLNNPPSGRCVPQFFNTVDIAPGRISSTGLSNLGPFTATISQCLVSAPPTDIRDGRFTYTFRAGDTITGTSSGSVVASATPGMFNATEALIITGGTGRFTGATGTITSNGQLRFGAGPTGIFSGTLAGSIDADQNVAGDFGTALGGPAAATGRFSTALGAFSIATGEAALAAGSFAEATAPGAVAIGDGSLANALNATAVGQATTAQGVAATAIGHNADATGLASFAGGVSAQATGMGATAVGRIANASAAGSTALGANAAATFAGSTAIGTNAATTAVNQVSLGATGSTVRVGDIAASTAAQSGTVSVATVDAAGTLGRNSTIIPSIAALQASSSTQGMQIATVQGQIDGLFDLADLNRRDIRRANEGVAMALAMDSPHLSSTGRFAVSGGLGVFGDRVAGTAAMTARIGPASAVTAGVGVGFKSGRVGAKAGFQHEW